jgi:AraC family transcriptional regulator
MSNALRVAHGVFGRVALLDMDRQLVRHAHPHCHVLLKVEGGDTQFAVRDAIAPLTEANAVLINAWEPHAYAHDPRRERTIILALYIEPSWLKTFRPNWAASGAPGFFDRATGELSQAIRKLRDDLAAAMINAPEAVREHEALLADLMIAVIERFTPWRTISASLRTLAQHSIVDPRVRRSIELMRSAPGEIRDMDALARDSGLSRAQFFRRFESSIRVPPRVFLNMLRMEAAVAAVVEGKECFAAISERLGFSAPAHFTRFFRDHAGSCPSEFRSVALGRHATVGQGCH